VLHIARYQLDTDSEVEGFIHQDAEVSTTSKWIFDSGASTHRKPDKGLFRDIWHIRGEVRVGNGAGIAAYRIITISSFVVLKDECIKNVI
jgi:hypothetical protein